MRKLFSFILTVAVLSGLLSACSHDVRDTEQSLSVVATIFAPFDFARALVGDKGDVTMLLPPGAEVHSYEPSPKDIIKIQNCDVFIYIGGKNDAWVADVLESIGEGVLCVTLTDCVELLPMVLAEGMQPSEHEHHIDEVEYDEHIWTSPRNAYLITQKICAALCEADPENCDYFNMNLDSYSTELTELDGAFIDAIKNGVRDTIVFADRFPLIYFTKAYGLNYYAAYPGCSDDSEPSAATVTFLIDKVIKENIPVVFHIELSNEELADTICTETGAKKLLFSACHNITRNQFEAGISYLDLMWANVDTLKEALG